MVDTFVRPDQRTDAVSIGDSARARTWTLAVACMGVGLVVGSMTALNTALGDLAVATSATQTQLTWVVDGYTLALACLLLPAGAIGDRYGRRGALLTGLVIFSLGSIAPAILHSPLQIIAGRAVAGVGAAFVMPATLSLLTVAYPKEARLKAVGIWAGTAGSGGVLGMLGSGLLLRFWDWHAIFWSLGIAGLVIFALACTVCIVARRRRPPSRLAWSGPDRRGGGDRGVRDPGSAPSGLERLRWSGADLSPGGHRCGVRRSRIPTGDNHFWMCGCSATPISPPAWQRSSFCSARPSASSISACSTSNRSWATHPLRRRSAFGPFMVPLGIFSALSFWYVPKLGLRLVLFVGMLLMAVGFVCMQGLGPEFDVSRFGVADVDTRYGHRILHGAYDFGDHGRGSRRKARRCLRGERHLARDGRGIGNRRGRFDPGRTLFPRARTAIDGLSRRRSRPGHRLAGQGARGGRPSSGPQGSQLAELSQDGFHDGHARFDDRDGRDRWRRRGPDRAVGSRARRAAATPGTTTPRELLARWR